MIWMNEANGTAPFEAREPRGRHCRAAGLVVLLLVLLSGASHAAIVEFGYQGTVTAIDPGLAAALPADSGIVIGAPMAVIYTFESTTPDADPNASLGSYPGTIQSWSLKVGSYTFDHDGAGPVDEIAVLFQFGSAIYEAVDSVTASPAIGGFSDLRSDVLFVGLSTQLIDDSLPTVPLDVTDPNWAQHEGGLLDAAKQPLIGYVLNNQCSSPCNPLPPPSPVPVGAPALLALALLATGARARWARRP